MAMKIGQHLGNRVIGSEHLVHCASDDIELEYRRNRALRLTEKTGSGLARLLINQRGVTQNEYGVSLSGVPVDDFVLELPCHHSGILQQ